MIWRRLVLALLAVGCATAPAAAVAQTSSASYLTVYKDGGPITGADLAGLQMCKDTFEAKRPSPPDGTPPSLEFIQAEVTAINQCAEDSRLEGVRVEAAPSPIAPVLRLLH